MRNVVQTNLYSVLLLNKIFIIKKRHFFYRISREACCKQYLKDQREAAGIVYRKCGSSTNYWSEV